MNIRFMSIVHEVIRGQYRLNEQNKQTNSNKRFGLTQTPCIAFVVIGKEEWEDQVSRFHHKEISSQRRRINREMVNKKSDQNRAKNTFLWKTTAKLQRATCMVLRNRTSAPLRKMRLIPPNKARKKTSKKR